MDLLSATTMAIPKRVHALDDPAEILRFAAEEAEGGGAALATLVEIRGGAARSLGAHLAVAADGRFCGYVSGGCVESAVAMEALLAIEECRDRTVKFGDGSPFLDIVLPCGGGITVAIHVIENAAPIWEVINALRTRKAIALVHRSCSGIEIASKIPFRSGWRHDDFVSVYRPPTRLVVSGQGGEVDAVRRLAKASGYEALVCERNVQGDRELIDAYTAVVLLHHDLDHEATLLGRALASAAFYIGALGSTRTHQRRIERLKAEGVPAESFDRIKAPIGMFGPTRDAGSLALSVLADVAAARMVAFA